MIDALETHPTEPSSKPDESKVVLKFAIVLLFIITAVVYITHAIRASAEQFDYPHAFVSADVAATARTFATIGVLHLHGVPVNNNSPIGSEDSYTHWPPLLPILLSLCYRAFGASERVTHLLMLCIMAATVTLVFILGQRWLGLVGGALAGFFWLTLPVTQQFGHLASQQSLMTLFMVAAALAFLTDYESIGALLVFLGAITSWEIVLIVPGLFLASRWRPELRRSAIASAIGAGTAVALVAALYLLNSRGLAMDTLQAVKFYTGMSPLYSHLLPRQPTLGQGEQTRLMLLNNAWMLGPLGIGAAIQLFTSRANKAMLAASLATPWLVWCAVMRNHMARHHFEFAIAAPFVAMALAWLATTPSKHPALKIGVLAALVGIQIVLLPKLVINDGYDPHALIRYAQGIRQSTEPNSIVLAPLISAVPLYYSERHIIRGVDDAESVAVQVPILQREFPFSPIYLAIPPALAGSFPGHPIVTSNADVVVLRLSDLSGGH